MRRRSGLRSFPRRSPSIQGYPDSSSPPDASTSRSPAPAPSAASPGPPAARRTPCANESTSVLRSRLPSLPVPSSCRSLLLLQSDVTDSPLAQAGTSCLVPYALLVQCLSSPLAHFKPGTPKAKTLTAEQPNDDAYVTWNQTLLQASRYPADTV